jgi:hypothetical protein
MVREKGFFPGKNAGTPDAGSYATYSFALQKLVEHAILAVILPSL